MSLIDNLPHTVTHRRPSYARDEYGGNLETTTNVATGVSAWVQMASANQISEFAKRDQLISHTVYFESDPGLRPGDSIIVSAGPSFVGVEMEYVAGTDYSAGLGVLYGAAFQEENNPRRT